MLSRLRPFRASLPIVALYSPVIHHSFRHTTTEQLVKTEEEEPSDPRSRPMKRPILRGRKWTKDDKRPGYIEPDDVPNPFKGKGLPYGRRIVWENKLSEELARGKYWFTDVDRNSEHQELDFIERGWANEDFYRIPQYKRPFDDITSAHDIDYHYHINNLLIHIHMARHIPHLAPLWPELQQDFDNLTAKWQDMLSEVLGDDNEVKKGAKASRDTGVQESETETSTEEFEEVEERTVDFEGKTKTVTRKITTETTRRVEVKKEITKRAVKQFVDDCVEERDFVRLIFIDALGTKHYVYGMVGETLLQCCRRYSIHIDGYCNGYDRGHIRIYGWGAWCTLCQMDISPRYFHLMPPFDWQERYHSVRYRSITPTSRLGCVIWIRPEFDGMVVNIPITLFQPYHRWED